MEPKPCAKGGFFNFNYVRAPAKKKIDNLFYKISLFMYVHYEKLFNKQFTKNISFIMHIMIPEKVMKIQ